MSDIEYLTLDVGDDKEEEGEGKWRRRKKYICISLNCICGVFNIWIGWI